MNILKRIREKRALDYFRLHLKKGQEVTVKVGDKKYLGFFKYYGISQNCIVFVKGYGFMSKRLNEIEPYKNYANVK